MAVFMIGYDLDKPGQDYTDLISAIKQLGAWWHCLDSTWIVNCDYTAVEIRNHLKGNLDQNDRLLVAKLGAPAAWTGFSDECSNWLTNNLS